MAPSQFELVEFKWESIFPHIAYMRTFMDDGLSHDGSSRSLQPRAFLPTVDLTVTVGLARSCGIVTPAYMKLRRKRPLCASDSFRRSSEPS